MFFCKTVNIPKESDLPKKEFNDSGITQGLKWQLREIEKIDFKNTNQNIVIVGDVAAHISRKAIQKSAKAIYFTEEDFIAVYKTQKTTRARIHHSDLIVIDELFHLTPSTENLVYLYKTIMFLSEARSFIFVTNDRYPSGRTWMWIHI